VRILVLDDQGLAEREETFRRAFASPELELTIWTALPADPTAFQGFDVISWDNDLGDGVDVVRWLSIMFWTEPGQFQKLFKSQFHLVHSANIIAADRMLQIFRDMGADAERCSILSYRPIL